MAKTKAKTKVNKSAEVRNLLEQDPKMSAPKIVETLKDQGIKISSGFVYTIKTKMRSGNGGRKKSKRTSAYAGGRTANPVDAVLKVKNLADELGGMKNLKKLVDAISE